MTKVVKKKKTNGVKVFQLHFVRSSTTGNSRCFIPKKDIYINCLVSKFVEKGDHKKECNIFISKRNGNHDGRVRWRMTTTHTDSVFLCL